MASMVRVIEENKTKRKREKHVKRGLLNHLTTIKIQFKLNQVLDLKETFAEIQTVKQQSGVTQQILMKDLTTAILLSQKEKVQVKKL
jgi:hypothetical protein